MGDRNGHGRILQPGLAMLQIEHVAHAGESATPVQVPVNEGGKLTVHTLGGFTRREYAALQIFPALIAAVDESGNIQAIARASWAMAGDLLSEYAALAKQEAETLAAITNGEARKIEQP